MPLKIGSKRYKKFSTAAAAMKKKKGFSKKRAAAYVAAIARKTGDLPAKRKNRRKRNSSQL